MGDVCRVNVIDEWSITWEGALLQFRLPIMFYMCIIARYT